MCLVVEMRYNHQAFPGTTIKVSVSRFKMDQVFPGKGRAWTTLVEET
jgi:hypothetical protein